MLIFSLVGSIAPLLILHSELAQAAGNVGFRVRLLRFEAMTPFQQVRSAASVHVLAGMHGGCKRVGPLMFLTGLPTNSEGDVSLSRDLLCRCRNDQHLVDEERGPGH